MIVQCNKCLTKFKISDEKIKGKIVRIRCARCHQPFTVEGEKLEETKEPNNKDHEAGASNKAAQRIKTSDKDSTPENNPDSPSSEAGSDQKDLPINDEAGELYKDIHADEPPKGFSAAKAFDLSIGAPLDETHSSADPSGEAPSSNDQPSADKDAASARGTAIELNPDAASVEGEEGEEQEQPKTYTALSDDLDLDFSEDDSDDEDEFIPNNAPPEEIIEDSDDDELELGVGTGIVVIDPDDTEPDQPEPGQGEEDSSYASIEGTLEESGFGFSVDEAQDGTETDFTKDIGEFPEIAESEETEFPDLGSEFDSGLDSALKKDLEDEAPPTKDDQEDFGIEDLSEDDSSENTLEDADALPEEPEEIQQDADSEQAASQETPESEAPETNTTDENKDDFGLDEEYNTTDSTDDEFAVIAEPTPGEDNKDDNDDDNDEVFKGFADDLEEDAASDTSDTSDADPAEESQDKTSNTVASSDDTAPYADQAQAPDPAPEPYDKQYEEPAQVNYNHEPSLPFQMPSSPKPNITFTPQPPIESSDYDSIPATSHARSKGTKSRWLPIIVLAIIVYGGIAALYSVGIIGQPQVSQAELTPIRVERIRGVFVKNKEMGRIFAIEGRIRNFSEEPQGIRMLRGVLKDAQGRVIAAKKVTPGKIISKEALKTISRNNLRKQLNGVSGGSIPPKGSIPVMIVFTKLPKGFAGAGVEVYRR